MVEVVNLVNQSIFSGVRLWIDNIKERYPPGKLEYGVIWGYVKMTKNLSGVPENDKTPTWVWIEQMIRWILTRVSMVLTVVTGLYPPEV